MADCHVKLGYTSTGRQALGLYDVRLGRFLVFWTLHARLLRLQPDTLAANVL